MSVGLKLHARAPASQARLTAPQDGDQGLETECGYGREARLLGFRGEAPKAQGRNASRPKQRNTARAGRGGSRKDLKMAPVGEESGWNCATNAGREPRSAIFPLPRAAEAACPPSPGTAGAAARAALPSPLQPLGHPALPNPGKERSGEQGMAKGRGLHSCFLPTVIGDSSK